MASHDFPSRQKRPLVSNTQFLFKDKETSLASRVESNGRLAPFPLGNFFYLLTFRVFRNFRGRKIGFRVYLRKESDPPRNTRKLSALRGHSDSPVR